MITKLNAIQSTKDIKFINQALKPIKLITLLTQLIKNRLQFKLNSSWNNIVIRSLKAESSQYHQ